MGNGHTHFPMGHHYQIINPTNAHPVTTGEAHTTLPCHRDEWRIQQSIAAQTLTHIHATGCSAIHSHPTAGCARCTTVHARIRIMHIHLTGCCTQQLALSVNTFFLILYICIQFNAPASLINFISFCRKHHAYA